MIFLDEISKANYHPTLKDYKEFFHEKSEIEIALREQYYLKNKQIILSENPDSKSLTIETILNNKTFKYLLRTKNIQKCNWLIRNKYQSGSIAIIYEVGIDCSPTYFKVTMVDQAYKKECGICDILIGDKSIFFDSKDNNMSSR